MWYLLLSLQGSLETCKRYSRPVGICSYIYYLCFSACSSSFFVLFSSTSLFLYILFSLIYYFPFFPFLKPLISLPVLLLSSFCLIPLASNHLLQSPLAIVVPNPDIFLQPLYSITLSSSSIHYTYYHSVRIAAATVVVAVTLFFSLKNAEWCLFQSCQLGHSLKLTRLLSFSTCEHILLESESKQGCFKHTIVVQWLDKDCLLLYTYIKHRWEKTSSVCSPIFIYIDHHTCCMLTHLLPWSQDTSNAPLSFHVMSTLKCDHSVWSSSYQLNFFVPFLIWIFLAKFPFRPTTSTNGLTQDFFFSFSFPV